MCGIAGLYRDTLDPGGRAQVLQQMADALVHRGPDQEGFVSVPRLQAGLASRRLSFVDLEGGRQPISNEDETIHVVLNGEIYNHRELRRLLEAKGHRFRTRCDTEVIVHAYEQYGADVLQKINGMFALAVLDTRDGSLLLARDGPGMRHLYWASTPSGFLFSSEVRSLLASGLLSAEPNLDGIRAYLRAGFVPAPNTGFRVIRKLPPGGWLRVRGARISEGRHWQMEFHEPGGLRKESDYTDELGEVLDQAVRSHLEADVPVGAFVSGGWDSSLVAALAAEASGGRLKTFSIVFPEDGGADESSFSQLVAQRIGSEHTEVEHRTRQIPDLILEATRHLEEPVIRAPFLLSYQLAAVAGKQVKTVLTGEGADELFGGYVWFQSKVAAAAEALNGYLPHSWARALSQQGLSARLRLFCALLAAHGQRDLDLEWLHQISPPTDRRLLNEDFRGLPADLTGMLPKAVTLDSCRGWLERRLALEFHGRMPDGILFETDKVSMAHSLELRMPFLDRAVVDFALRLPARFKIRGNQEKYLLGHLVRQKLPAAIRNRKKMGLTYPRDFAEKEPVAQFIREVLLDSPNPVPALNRRAIARHIERRKGLLPLWKLMVLQCWWNEFFTVMERPRPQPGREWQDTLAAVQ